MIRWIASCLIILMSGLAFNAAAQGFDPTEFEAFVEETMAGSNVPGLAVIVFDENGSVYENTFGIAGPDNRAVTLDTPFQLGSVSKSFAALVMVQLASEGQLDLDTPVITYLPDFRTRGTDGGKTITVRHILSHRSGFATLEGNRIQDGTYRGADALDIAVKDLGKAKLKTAPGTQFEYSNANYMIAAAIIETVTGQPYETILSERVFIPLGMANSYVQMPTGKSVKEATGFRQWFGHSRAFPNIAGRAYVAAGGVTASARDLAAYVNAVAQQDPRIMPAALAGELTTRQGDNPLVQDRWGYGLGWMIDDVEDKTIIYHSGLNGGFAAQAAFLSGSKRGAVVLTNQSGILQADVPGGVARKGLGLDPGPIKPSTRAYIMIWSLVATVLGLLFSFILSTRRFTAYAKRAEKVNIFRRVIPSLALFGLAYGLAFIVPRLNLITLSGIKVFFPDLWLCLTLSAAIAVIWGITRLAYPYKKR